MASKAHKDFRARVDAMTPKQRKARVWVENTDGVRTPTTMERGLFMEYRGEGRICGPPADYGKAQANAPGGANTFAPTPEPELVACVSCAELIAPGSKFCPECGAPQVEPKKSKKAKAEDANAALGDAEDDFDGQPWPLDDEGNRIQAVDAPGAPVPDFGAMKWHQIQAWCKHAGVPPMKKPEAIAALFSHYGVGDTE